MALFSASESVYLSSFLSTVDLDSSVNHDGSIDPNFADQILPTQGSEALTKATKDLMSLEPFPPPRPQSAGQTSHPRLHTSTSTPPNYWPSLPPGEQPTASSSAQQQHQAAYNPNIRPPSPSHYFSLGLSGNNNQDPLRSNLSNERSSNSVFTSHLAPQQRPQIAPLHASYEQSSSAGYNLPSLSTAGLQNGQHSNTHDAARPSPGSLGASASSVLSTTSSKRALPASSQPATDPSSSKRPRPSPASTSSFPARPGSGSGADSAPGPAGSTSGARARHTTSAGPSTSRDKIKEEKDSTEKAAEKDKDKGAKGALLSPSQKRANHIQSEQKRRANIRRGYEALCEAVPALREAIRAEEERERMEADEAAAAKGKGRAGAGGGGAGGADRGKKKRKSEGERADGRAGPRSENVVLQKTIDYISALLADRDELSQRLQIARGVLPLGHPAARVDPMHLDAQGEPLWEREWNGGMDLDLGGGDDGSEDEG
ncbi:hypothetical protein C2E23DRAFT_856882 [Lenzites betulinus]|nr:hypothetical protein C2E23DRAFT_856882 [Lenzites betulinus]